MELRATVRRVFCHRLASWGRRRARLQQKKNCDSTKSLGVGEHEVGGGVVDDDGAFTKKKVGAAALDESDGRRSASEAGRAPAQRPRRDRGIAAKQCRSSQPANRLGQIRGDGGLGTARRPRGHRAGARQARVLTAVSRRSEAS